MSKVDKRREPKKDEPVRIDMTFEQALKKALNTPKIKKQPKKSTGS